MKDFSRQRTILALGTKINVLESTSALSDDNDRPILVLLHGWLSSSRIWRRIFRSLSRQARVLAPDLPGFGRSQALYGSYELASLVAMLTAILDQLMVKRVTIIGHGLGGAMAIGMALKHPARVESLLLVSPCVGLNPLAGTSTRFLALSALGRLRFRHMLGFEATRNLLLKHFYHDPEAVQDSIVRDLLRDLQRPGHRGAAWKALGTHLNPGLQGKLSAISCPTTIVWGANDRMNPLDAARELTNELTSARFRLVPNAGHMLVETRPRSFAHHLAGALGLDLELGDVPDWHPGPPVGTPIVNSQLYLADLPAGTRSERA